MAAAVVLAAASMGAGAPVAPASAEALSPWWGVSTGSQPTNLVSGKTGRIVVTAENRGDAPTAGEVTIVDALPAGLEAVAIKGIAGDLGERGPVSCTLETLTCTFGDVERENSKGEQVLESLRPYEEIEVDISVSVRAGARTGEENTVSVSGGGASGTGTVSASRPIEVDGGEHFGVEDFQVLPENAGGSIDTQAGSHPFQLTTVFTLNTTTPGSNGGPRTVALPRDMSAQLPAGLIADPAAIVRCGEAQFAEESQNNGVPVAGGCPAQSVVGVATVSIQIPPAAYVETITTPIFNVAPLPGEPARFAIAPTASLSAFLESSLRSGGDYGVTLALRNITQEGWLLGVKLSVWGVPGDQRHDGQRGFACLREIGVCPSAPPIASPPLLTMPTACAGPLQSTVEGDSWQQANLQEAEGITPTLAPLTSTIMSALDGCDALPFHPEIDVAPDGPRASTPSGFDVDVHVPDEGASNPADLAESTIKDITVAFPEGVALNPAVADGLEACSEAQVGFTGFGELDPVTEPGLESPAFTGKLPGSLAALVAGDSEPLRPGVNFCPDASKIGTVTLKTPLLANPLEGEVYLAAPQSFPGGPSENPFGSLVAVYVVAEEPESGVLVKLPGELSLNQQTGQITASFQNTPQLPLEELDLAFFEGERAPLSTPARCGVYTTTATLQPWSGEPAVSRSSDFEITSGPDGGPCPGTILPFAPSMTAGTTSIDAGASTPLTATISRPDGQQAIQSVQLKLPPGLSGILAGVPLCPEAQANAGSCGAASEIGETTIGAGLGGDPYTITGGRVYLTEKYEGAPFGLSITVPARVGPFTLQEGRPIVVRAKLEIDPATAALTIATGSIPNIIEGFPLQIQHLNITIDRTGFTLNPTSCSPMSITGTIDGSEGASAAVSSSFHVANCATLKFAPKFSASTEGHAEALKGGSGASLNVKLASRGAVSGEEANIKRVDLRLPRLLPARLQPTLQNACTKAQFAKDPANCPPDSFVGTATAVTPMLGVPLEGRAIFVSQGGIALPDLDLVLRGEGVEMLITGHTDVEGGVTYAKFEAFPDVPISSFALSLPEGPHSALASGLPTNKHSLCGQSLQMPATIEAQNGAVVKQTTRVTIAGCKPMLYIRSTKVSGNAVTLTVTVPSAGRLTASARGLIAPSGASKASKSTSSVAGATLTLELHLTTTQAAKLSKTHKLTTRPELVFTPKHGRKLTKSVAVTF
jgi:hypothetical protein